MATALPMILCAGLGLTFGWWVDFSNRLSTRIGLRVLKGDRSKFPAYLATSGLLYVFLLLAGATVCLLLAHLITAGDLDAFWALLAGLAAYLAVTRLGGWGRSSDGGKQ